MVTYSCCSCCETYSTGKEVASFPEQVWDVFLGLPFNILSYAFILHVLAKLTGLVPHELIFSGGDLHIYENHIDQCQEILRREPMALAERFIMPEEMTLQDFTNQKFTAKDFELVGYQSHGVLKGIMS